MPRLTVKLCRVTELVWDAENGRNREIVKRCRDWRDCGGKAWYALGDIHNQYCRYQVMWLIGEMIERDNETGEYTAARTTWPGDPGESGYTDAEMVQRSRRNEPAYEVILQVVGEVCERLQRTGRDGKDLYNECKNPENDQGGAGYTDYNRLSAEARSALGYVNGRNAKTSGYVDWKKQRNKRDRRAAGERR